MLARGEGRDFMFHEQWETQGWTGMYLVIALEGPQNREILGWVVFRHNRLQVVRFASFWSFAPRSWPCFQVCFILVSSQAWRMLPKVMNLSFWGMCQPLWPCWSGIQASRLHALANFAFRLNCLPGLGTCSQKTRFCLFEACASLLGECTSIFWVSSPSWQSPGLGACSQKTKFCPFEACASFEMH